MAMDNSNTSTTTSKIDVRVDSPRKLFRQLHDLLDENDYDHEYRPLKAEKDAINDTAIFENVLVGMKDTQGYDKVKLTLAFLLALTIIFIPIAAWLLKSSLYPLRTIIKIHVEGEVYRTKIGSTKINIGELLDVISDARVTLDMDAGIAAEDDYEILEPTKIKREKRQLEEEQLNMQDHLTYLLLSAALPMHLPQMSSSTCT
ncbi:MAG: hypothetical protein GY861_02050 [bacterium]|nr:hypothetical protein [bacterium]